MTDTPTRRRHTPRTLALAACMMFTVSACAGNGATSSNMNPAIVAGISDNEQRSNCLGDGSDRVASLLGTGSASDLNESQNKIAQALAGEAKARKLPTKAAEIVTSVGLVESELRNLDHGDEGQGVTNPDGTPTTSRGVLQQQDFWGPLKVRMDPAGAAGLFFDRLVKINGWESKDPGAVAQQIQGSAFPDKYNERMGQAKEIVAKVGTGYSSGGSDASDSPSGTSSPSSSGDAIASTATTSDTSSSDDGFTSNSLCDTVAGAIGKVAAGLTAGNSKGDDYPKDMKPNSGEIAAGFSGVQDPWGLYRGQCVSYVAWRLNVSMGYKKEDGDKYPFTMAKFNVAGQGMGWQWSSSMGKAGFKTDKKPKPGAVAWWDKNKGVAGEMGHVAIVEKVQGDRVYVSQYNASPKVLQYSEAWFNIDDISGFVHVADYPDGKTRIEAPAQ